MSEDSSLFSCALRHGRSHYNLFTGNFLNMTTTAVFNAIILCNTNVCHPSHQHLKTQRSVRNAWTSYLTKGCSCQQPHGALGRPVRSISQNQIFWCSANVLPILPTCSMNETEWRTNFPTRISRSSRPASCIPFTSTQTQEDSKWSRRHKKKTISSVSAQTSDDIQFNRQTYNNGVASHYTRY